MFLEKYSNISIAGIQAVVPSTVSDNMDFSDIFGERRCRRQIQLTGVQHRHLSPPGQTGADMAYSSAYRLMKEIDWKPNEIDVLIFATQKPLFALPSTAFLLQKELKIKQSCTVFDINLGCPAAIVGIKLVASLLQNLKGNGKGLLLISDPVYAHKNREEITPDELLFGSAGAAIAIEKKEHLTSEILICNKSDGNRYSTIIQKFKEKYIMDGEKVFSFAINDVARDISDFFTSNEIKKENIDFYFFHQAQALILSTINEVCGIPPEQELRSLEQYGNTRGSSIFVTLCQHAEKLHKKERIKAFMCAFGGGLAWGNMLAELKTNCIFSLYFDDGIYIKN